MAPEPLAALGRLPAALRADLLVSWIAGAGTLRYLAYVTGAPRRSPLEARAAFLVGVLGAMCLLRTLAWLAPSSTALGVLGYLPTTLLPLAMCVFVEGLLRRHVSRPLKIAAALTTAVGVVLDLLRPVLGEARVWPLLGRWFPVALLAVMAALGLVLARRDRHSLSRAENALIRAIVWLAALGVPLTATDFRLQLAVTPLRLGAIAVLLLPWTLLRRQRPRERATLWLRDVLWLAARAALVTAALVLLLDLATDDAVRLGGVAMALVLLLAIDDRLREAARRRRAVELLDWLATPVPDSLAAFTAALRRLPLTVDALVVHEADLAAYDADALRAVLRAHGPVLSLSRLRALADGGGTEVLGAEELVDLLARNEMTHVGSLREAPLCLLLAAAPELSGAGDVEPELAAVLRRGQHALAREALSAAATARVAASAALSPPSLTP